MRTNTTATPSAIALRVFRGYHVGSYIEGIGPMAGTSTRLNNTTGTRALRPTSPARTNASRDPAARI